MAHKKGGGSSRNGRDSNSQRLGVKRYSNEFVIPGNIIVRQHGTHYYPGPGTGMGKDYTIFATEIGYVSFNWARGGIRLISVLPERKIGQPGENATMPTKPAATSATAAAGKAE